MKNRHRNHNPGKASAVISTCQEHVDPEGLVAIEVLLKADLSDVRFQQEDAARASLSNHPSNWKLILAVRRWARAIADVCRSHVGKCVEIHASSRSERDPATSAMVTILLAVSDHLGLPADATLLSQDWPEDNGVRKFVLQAAGAPIKLIDGELVTESTLPRLEPKSRFARRLAGFSDDRFDSAPFLSVDETQQALRGLEESFRTAFWDRLGTVISESKLHSILHSIRGRAQNKNEHAFVHSPDYRAVSEDHNGFNLAALSQEEVEKKRASDIVTVTKEIAAVRSRMDSDDDYDRLKAEYPTLILFKECDKDPELKSLFLGIKGHHQRKALRFAKQVAASHNGVKLNTIEKAWDRHNPNKKSRRHMGTAPASPKGATRPRSTSHG